MSEYTLGTGYLLIDPFTPNEHWVPVDSPEAQAWKPSGPSCDLTVTNIDYEKRTVTLNSSSGESRCIRTPLPPEIR